MSTKTFTSISNINIRLTSERFDHIISNHPEVKDYIWDLEAALETPDFVYEGTKEEYIALRRQKNGYYFVVIYKEDFTIQDGFVITAFITSRITYFLRKKLIWKNK